MRKSRELAFAPKPLSGIARISPGLRPLSTAEKPSTGCDGVGNEIPLIVWPAKNDPDGGPGAYVATGSTARPSSVGSGVEADAGLATTQIGTTENASARKSFMI